MGKRAAERSSLYQRTHSIANAAAKHHSQKSAFKQQPCDLPPQASDMSLGCSHTVQKKEKCRQPPERGRGPTTLSYPSLGAVNI